MSKSVTYSILIRDGNKRCFEDLWVPLYRELLWGPDAFEAWLREGEESEWEPEELAGLAVVDFDSNELRWGEREVLELPRVRAAHQRLLQQAWPGFKIRFLEDDEMYAEIYGPSEDEASPFDDRPETIREAAGLCDDEDDDDEEYEDEEDEGEAFDEDYPGAWLTIIDDRGTVRHRLVRELSADLLGGDETVLQAITDLKSAEVPPEAVVKEGCWINVKDRAIGVWGGTGVRRCFPAMEEAWSDWRVSWAEQGYADQGAASGVPGIAMTDAQVLARFMRNVLSAKRLDMANALGSMGGQLKKTALQATGCLVLLLSLPILLVGYLMGRLKEAGYGIIGLVVIVAIAFKVIEWKIKAKFRQAPFNQQEQAGDTRPPAAGPLDEPTRRQALDQLLIASGFPSLAEIEPHFPAEPSLDDLL